MNTPKTYWTADISAEDAISLAIAKARKEFDGSITGAIVEFSRHEWVGEECREVAGPQVIVYGGCNEEEWNKARCFNEGILVIYRPKDLI